MPSHYHSEKKGIHVDRLVQKIAIVQDQDYPEALNGAPDSQVAIAVREDFKRHELLGLNVFLLEMLRAPATTKSGASQTLSGAPDAFIQQPSSHPLIGGVGLSAIASVLASCLEWPVRAP